VGIVRMILKLIAFLTKLHIYVNTHLICGSHYSNIHVV